jgi:hypothetical protein
MKRILSVLAILCAAALTVPAMANATTAAKHPKTTAASSSTMPAMQMHNTKTTASATHTKTSAKHHESTSHARETHHNKKESKKG